MINFSSVALNWLSLHNAPTLFVCQLSSMVVSCFWLKSFHVVVQCDRPEEGITLFFKTRLLELQRLSDPEWQEFSATLLSIALCCTEAKLMNDRPYARKWFGLTLTLEPSFRHFTSSPWDIERDARVWWVTVLANISGFCFWWKHFFLVEGFVVAWNIDLSLSDVIPPSGSKSFSAHCCLFHYSLSAQTVGFSPVAWKCKWSRKLSYRSE